MESSVMQEQDKKTAMRMIPYGLYVLTGRSAGGEVAAATINWVTQGAFSPPQLVVGVKADSGAHAIIKETGVFALNILGKEQGPLAYTFFKPVEQEGDAINGEAFHAGSTGAPILDSVPAWLECRLVETVETGDHSVFVGEVIDAGVNVEPEGRPDDVTLLLKDLGEKVFYGG
jgi:flavin reductase (DIM6/NTAB) family NADH-FMN oxidoreductase RutF